MYVSQGEVAVCQGVKMVDPTSFFGMMGTNAMDVYLMGGVDRPAASGSTITAAATTPSTITYLHLPLQHQYHSASIIKKHQKSHHV